MHILTLDVCVGFITQFRMTYAITMNASTPCPECSAVCTYWDREQSLSKSLQFCLTLGELIYRDTFVHLRETFKSYIATTRNLVLQSCQTLLLRYIYLFVASIGKLHKCSEASREMGQINRENWWNYQSNSNICLILLYYLRESQHCYRAFLLLMLTLCWDWVFTGLSGGCPFLRAKIKKD